MSFPSGKERHTPLRLELVERATAADITLPEAIDDLLAAILPLAQYADPDDPVGGVLFWPPDPWLLQDHDDLGPWIGLAASLIGAEPPTKTDKTVRMGPSIKQQIVPNAAAAGD